MQDFIDYTIKKLISENSTTQIYLADNKEGNECILKILRKEHVNSDTVARYKKEHEIGSSISSDLILKSKRFVSILKKTAIEFENFESISLKELINQTNGINTIEDLIRFLKISKQIVQAIGTIHDHKYIHRDINPTNILINISTNKIKIIDFGLATEFVTGRSVLKGFRAIEGTLPYMSPEQTGRVNRILDYHTDYYSLGICMYELLTGKLPFVAGNLREWVHAQVARQALPLQQVNKLIPNQVAILVRKLMNKDAGLRYQSAHGLISDLENCIQQLSSKGKIESFKLGENDISNKFHLPQKLYGREKEVAELLSYYHDVRKGHTGFVFVKGEPGVGKSAFVGELYKMVTEHNGYFTKGKFKQLNQAKPYSAIIQAFSQLTNNMLAEEKSKLTKWKNLVEKKLNGNVQLIAEVIPELYQVIGSHNPVQKLPAFEMRNRFIVSFHDFVSTFVHDGNPLLIFLDDLQWADSASLELIQNIISDTSLGPILFIGGYRPKELASNKVVYNSVKNILNSDIFSKEIELGNLNQDTIKNIIVDIYACDNDQAEIVAEQCYIKTGGTPLFLIEFLSSLNKNNLIYFDKKLNKWACNIAKIKETKVTKNVVEFVSQNIVILPVEIQKILKVASCIGSTFDSIFLSLITEQNENSLVIDLDKAVKASMLIPVKKKYVYANKQEHLAVEYEFLHERVRQAAYSLLTDDERSKLHYVIAKEIVKHYNVLANSERLFSVVDHFNKGVIHLHTDEYFEIAKYNYEAGKQAKLSGAFQPAYNYFSTGVNLINHFSWTEHYELKLKLYTNTAEAAYLCGEYGKMEKLAQAIFSNAKNELDKAEIWNVRNLAYQAQRNYEFIEKDAFEFLSKLNVHVSTKPSNLSVIYSVLKTLFALRKYRFNDLKNLKSVKDKNIAAAMNMLGVMVYPYYGENPKLFVVMLTKLLRLSFKYGTVPISPFAFMMFGMIINAMFGKIEKGYLLGQAGLSLLNKIGDKKHWAEISVCYNLGVRIWKESIKSASEGLIDDYKIALETGDIEFAVMSLSSCSNYLFFQGENLTDILNKAEQYKRSLAHIPKAEGGVIMDMQLQAIENLQVKGSEQYVLEGKYFSENNFLKSGKRINDSILTNLYLLKMINAYLMGDYKLSLQFSQIGRKHIQGVVGIYHYAMFLFYESLILLANYNTYNAIQKQGVLIKVRRNQKKVKKWAKHAPMNFLNKYKLVNAELEKVQGNINVAGELYDESITLAEQGGFSHEEAIANEKAGELWLQQKRIRFAQVYLTKAVKLFQLWNANTKQKQLENKFREYLFHEKNIDSYLESRSFSATNSTISTDTIDLRTVLEASKTISGEIVLNDLFSKTLQIIMEYAGAQRGILLLLDQVDRNLEIEAIGNVQNDLIEVIQSKTEITDQLLPVTLVRYVERSKKPLVLNKAYEQGPFTKDSYIKSYQIESVLVLPIVQQSRLIGLMYLENNLSANVFTESQANILSLMCTQLAISIENARLYNTLEQKVQERTAEVMSQKLELQEQADNLKDANKQLEELNATKDKLFSIIGHDLSNPFNAIIGFSGLLLKNLDTLDEAEIRRRIGIINKSSKKSYDLLQNLLEWSRSQVDNFDFSPKKLWLRDLVNQNLSMLSAGAEAKYIVLSNNINEDIFVIADEYMLNTVIRNLVSNAIKFTNKGGEVKIKAEIHDKKVKTIITDNGVGIDSKNIDKLFDLNNSVSTVGTEKEKGTGLGLLLCKDLIERHGSKLNIESEMGIGTAISFTIPLAPVRNVN